MIYLPTDGLSPKELKETKQRIKKNERSRKGKGKEVRGISVRDYVGGTDTRTNPLRPQEKRERIHLKEFKKIRLKA